EKRGELLVIEIRLRVQLTGAPETMNLVGEVHLGWEILDAVERGVGDAVEVLDAVDPVVDEVARGGFTDRDVNGSRQPDLLRFFDGGRGLIAVHRSDQLDAVSPPR